MKGSTCPWMLTGVLALAAGISGCSAEPDGAGGLCEISCADAKIGSSQFKIKKVTPDVNLTCLGGFTGTRSIGGPILVQFMVIKEADLGTGNGSKAREIPVRNISIEPLIRGVMDEAATADEFKSGSTIVPYRYAGVKTPSAEWCSDSCGVVSLEVQPVCIEGATNNVTVSIHSGGLFPDDANLVNIALDNETEEETATP